ncbi:MAG TPA: LamG-like jellyroll fold domain-containing protein [Verrucomicrobiae bacterium]|nr:LamG-like jellyroll fold domain-containing protein [Verrucomicrobiae bacterium]
MKKSIVTLLVCLLASATFAQSIPQNGLIGWWRAEGNVQDSAGRHDGTLPFGMNFAPGKIGQAFDFDGSRRRVSIPDSPDFKLTKALTIEAWVYPRQYGGIIFFRGDDRPALDPWQVDLRTPGYVGFQIMDPQSQSVRIEAPIRLEQWQHVAATFGARGNLFLYVNGALAARTNTTLKPLDDLEPTQNPALGIGNIGGTAYNEPFRGMIDELALYSRALSPRQIRAIYQAGAGEAVSPAGGLTFREIRYDGRLADDEARLTLDVDATATGESSAPLLQGDVAVLPVKLPGLLEIVRDGNTYRLVASRRGHFQFKLEVVAKIQRDEPWNEISFVGPAATIASVTAQAGGTNTQVQLLDGTLLEAVRTNGVSRVTGFLGADQTVALRWQGKIAEVARKALLTVDSTIGAQITPTVIKYTSRFHYDVVQGNAAQLRLALPTAQALTRLEGDQIRDWHTAAEGGHQVLTVEFIKPIENAYDLALYTEQPVGRAASAAASLNPPQPLNVDRESGSLTISAEDMLAEIDSLTGLRQVNAPDNAVAAYRFNARPFTLTLRLKPVEPVINVADRVNARLEETRLVVAHRLTLNVEKAGIYTLELRPPSGFAVAAVRGDGLEDWKVSEGRLRVSFAGRVLGRRQLEVQLEQALKVFPGQISLRPLRMTGAARETAQIGVAAAPGIRLRTAELNGLREMPASRLPDHGDEILAYTAEQPDWQLAIASEKLAARVVADVFNLVTIGDGVVGGSATIRYSLANQGVQEFKVRVPAQFKNVEFTGPNIRRKESSRETRDEGRGPNDALDTRHSTLDTNDVVWTIGLQDKVWGGYTLVVTYDYPFDSSKGDASLPVGGIHTVDAERETGSIAVTTAASLQLNPRTVSDTLRRVDETELSAADRSFITRAVVLAWQYTGSQYDLALDVRRYATEPVLEAVADRTQIASVLTESGEMLTQASFMVKNNEKQFQRFQLPRDATLWSCYVNGQPAKPERDGGWVLVPLPRDVDRDQAFAVDIVYAQTNGALASHWSKTLELDAPRTDVPNTYAEWQLLAPPSFRLSHFGGSMNIAQGSTYGLLDAWEKFLGFYVQVLREAGGAILIIGFPACLVIALVISAVRRGWNGVLTLFVVMAILAILASMMLPALSAAKRKAQRINSVSNLKQIGVAVQLFAGDNNNRLPMSFGEMSNELDTDRITYDVETGQRFTYLGAGMSLDSLKPDSVLAYSPIVNDQCEVLFADGSVQQMTAGNFAQLSQHGLVQTATPQEIAVEQQRQAVVRGQLVANPPAAATAMPQAGRTLGVAGYGTGGGGGGPTTPGTPAAGVPSTVAPRPVATVAGIRSLRIELPQTGQPFLFTKVLNVRGEPLSIRARIMSLHTFQTLQMVWQSAVFLIGLIVWWVQWRRLQRSSFILTVALMLIIGSVCSLLVQWRALHDALIVGFPVVTLAVLAWLVWRYWPRRHKTEPLEPPPAGPPAPASGLPPVMAGIALLLTISLTRTSAANSELRTANSERSSIVSASYTGTVNDRVALLNATLQFSSAAPGRIVPLFGGDVAVQQFTVKDGSAELIRHGEGVAAQLNRRGTVTLQVKLLVKIAGDVAKRRLAFGIPPALSSQVALTLDESGADVDFPTAIAFQRIPDQDRTRVEAVVGSGARIELVWTPRVKRAAEVSATVFCRNQSLVTFGGGVVNVRATLDYQITQGELRQARVQLPPGQRLLRVEGKEIRSWEVKSSGSAGIRPANPEHAGETPTLPGGQILVVDLLKGVSSSWKLTIETEKTLAALPVSETVAVPHALEVMRETGLVALQGTEELGLSVESVSSLERVDAGEFTRAGADQTGRLYSVFRFATPDFALRVQAETVQPEIEAVVRNNFRVGAEQVSLSATIDYTIKRTGLFSLRVALPDGYRVERVTGDNILQYTEHSGTPASGPARPESPAERAGSETGAPGPRILDVILKDRTGGVYTLGIELTRSFKALPASLAIAGVHPLDTAKLTGFIAVYPTPGVGVKTESFDGLTEIPAVSLPEDATLARWGNVLAYKFISAEPKSVPGWRLSVATEAVAAWVRAEVVSTFAFTETLVSGRARVRYDIANAPVKELRVKVPAEFKNVEISGPNIRSKEQIPGGTINGGTSYTSPHNSNASSSNGGQSGTRIARPSETDYSLWRVELQSPVQGFYTLTVTWDQSRPVKTNAMAMTGVSAEGVERETGLLAVSAQAPLQVSELNAAELQRVDTGDFPDWAGEPDRSTALVYHYVRPGYRLTLEVRRFDEAEVLQALVDSAQITSVMADDGQMMTEMSLSVRNNGRQFLAIGLPAGAKVWSAFVAGQPVQPSLHDGKILLPIEQSGVDDGAMSVELTYVGTNTFPRTHGTVRFVSPKFDVPLKNARWQIYLPPDYDYQDFVGTMTRETVAAPAASSASFSVLDYSRMEQANRQQAEVEVRQDVSAAQRQLASGNVREASVNFWRAKVKSAQGAEEVQDVQKLEKDLQNAQASNLINAQSEFSSRNGLRAGGLNAPIPAGAPVGQYDTGAAAQQSEKLQQAQEIGATRVQPLHVNLPIRGAYYAFTQVLQTEPGKPMTIQMQAANTRAVNWPARIVTLAAAFLALWGLVALVSHLTLRAKPA